MINDLPNFWIKILNIIIFWNDGIVLIVNKLSEKISDNSISEYLANVQQ